MAYEYTGNAIPAPGFSQGTNTVDEELLFSTVGYTQKGVTLKSGQGVLRLGTFIKQDSATKKYVKTTASDAEGVLRMTVDTGSSADDQSWLGNIVVTGLLKLSHVKTANSGTITGGGLGGTVNEPQGFFKF